MEEMSIYDIIWQVSELYLNSINKADRVIARHVIKTFRWFFFSKWPEINNTKIMVGKKDDIN